MSGGVNVSGTITTGNSCSLKYWKVIGTTGGVNSQLYFALPSGCTVANTVGVYGVFFDGSSQFPFNNTYFQYSGANSVNASVWIHPSLGIVISVGAGATTAASAPFTVIIATIA